MVIKYIDIPFDDYGTVRVSIEPTARESIADTLGIAEQNSETNSFTELASFGEIKQQVIENVIVTARNAYLEMQKSIYVITRGVHDALAKIDIVDKPDEISVEFGLSISGEAGVVISNAGVEAAVKVKLTWKREDKK